jgi:hypothetical protein
MKRSSVHRRSVEHTGYESLDITAGGVADGYGELHPRYLGGQRSGDDDGTAPAAALRTRDYSATGAGRGALARSRAARPRGKPK